MKNKLFVILLSVLILGGCSSRVKTNIDELCRNYSNAYLVVGSMKEKGYSHDRAMACSLTSLTNGDTKRACLLKLNAEQYKEIIFTVSIKDKNMSKWMSSIVNTVYISPELKAYEWRDKKFKSCRASNLYEI